MMSRHPTKTLLMMTRISDKHISINDEKTSDEGTSNSDLSDECVSVDGESNTNDEIMCQIESNDPSITRLRVGVDDYYPPGGDWANLGKP